MSFTADAGMLAWALAALLFLLSMWRPAAGMGRRHRHAAVAGSLILAGAALYGADVINMPEIAAALVIGAALGLLFARDLPVRLLPRLLRMLGASAGVGMACMALAVRRNPYAFAMLGEGSHGIVPWRVAALAIALTGGAIAAGAGVARLGRGVSAVVALPLAGLLALLAAGSFALFGLREEAHWLVTGIALALPAGTLLGARARTGGEAALLGAICGLVGGSVAAMAFLLGNIGLAMSGGLAASAGTMLALRLCVGASGKGLADERRHP